MGEKVEPITTSKLIVFRGFETRGCYTVSPFVTKLEFRLRAGNLPYDVRGGSPSESPLGKIPYVDMVRFRTHTA